LQVDDDGSGGQRGRFPLYIALSLGGILAATLAVIGFVTFQHVESSAAYADAAPADSRVASPALTRVAVPDRAMSRAAAPPTTSRVAVRGPRHVVSVPRIAVSVRPSPPPAAPSAAPTAAPESESRAPAPAAIRQRPSGARRVAAATESAPGDPATTSDARPEVGAASPVILTATTVATPAPALPATAVNLPAASPPPTEAPAPEPTPAVVAAAPAPARPPQRVEARVKLAAEPDFPSDPSVAGLHGTSAVLVTIGPRGKVVNVALERSSGHASFDQAALNAARRTIYVPAVIDGKPTTASYRMVYEFGQ